MLGSAAPGEAAAGAGQLVLVVGATGGIGQYAILELLARGYKVVPGPSLPPRPCMLAGQRACMRARVLRRCARVQMAACVRVLALSRPLRPSARALCAARARMHERGLPRKCACSRARMQQVRGISRRVETVKQQVKGTDLEKVLSKSIHSYTLINASIN